MSGVFGKVNGGHFGNLAEQQRQSFPNPQSNDPRFQCLGNQLRIMGAWNQEESKRDQQIKSVKLNMIYACT